MIGGTSEQQKSKVIKDPIYGYINIDAELLSGIIDTPVFQRLRRVLQTSYSPLYSSALHNRFVHSLGVFYLGSIVADKLEESVRELFPKKVEMGKKLAKVFKLACLLHDVGHAPFSHTGEVFYKVHNEEGEKKVSYKKINDRVCELIDSEGFRNDLPKDSAMNIAPHELMSAIIGIKEFKSLIGDKEDCEFFARCITGLCYKNDEKDPEKNIRNCFITMLNSKVIDVDRLDYIIRDSYTSGYASVKIDYARLLGAITIKEYGDDYLLVYKKNAISIIENVVYAHDAEKKWIQNHPVVLYEAYIIRHILTRLDDMLENKQTEKRLFSEESLSVAGVQLSKNITISLLCDDDIMYLYKNVFNDELSNEYFDRNNRRHPVWKSESEYRAYVLNASNTEAQKLLNDLFSTLSGKMHLDLPAPTIISEATIKSWEDERNNIISQGENMKKANQRRLIVGRYLKSYAEEHGFPCDYVILPTTIFQSNFSKDGLKKTLISFDKSDTQRLGDVCTILSADKDDEKQLFYLYYRRGIPRDEKTGMIDDVKDFCEGLLNAIKNC